MKKTLTLLALCLSLTSCVLSDATEPRRTADNIKSTSGLYFNLAAVNPALAMDNCMLAYDFLNASEEEKKATRFSPISYTPATNTFKIGSWGTIETGGKDLRSLSTEWSITAPSFIYTVICTGDNQWRISGKFKEEDSIWKGFDFIASFTFTGKDADGFCTWLCNCSGVHKEDDRFSASFRSENSLTFKWLPTYTGYSTIYRRQVMSGTMLSSFMIDGKESDWCSILYKDGEITKALTSQDN